MNASAQLYPPRLRHASRPAFPVSRSSSLTRLRCTRLTIPPVSDDEDDDEDDDEGDFGGPSLAGLDDFDGEYLTAPVPSLVVVVAPVGLASSAGPVAVHRVQVPIP